MTEAANVRQGDGSEFKTREAPNTTSTPSPARNLVANAVTALFVPGSRSDRFAKAASTSTDLVILDLEDAVAPTDKADARAEVVSALSPGRGLRALVRINPAGSPHYASDVEALSGLSRTQGHGLLGLMVAKTEIRGTIQELASWTQPLDLALVPLIESAVGMVNAHELANVSGVTRLAFGAIDFALDIDADQDDRYMDHARSLLVLASRAAGISAPLDSPSTDINSMERIKDSARLARSFGFGGKLCIHPAQVEEVNAAFMPTEQDIAWAERVARSDEAILQVDGQMIDRPVMERAKRILQRASRIH